MRLESGPVVFEHLEIFFIELEAEQQTPIFRYVRVSAELGQIDGEVATDLTEQRLSVGEEEEEEEVGYFGIRYKHSNYMIKMIFDGIKILW